jgi:hypothetical protein
LRIEIKNMVFHKSHEHLCRLGIIFVTPDAHLRSVSRAMFSRQISEARIGPGNGHNPPFFSKFGA